LNKIIDKLYAGSIKNVTVVKSSSPMLNRFFKCTVAIVDFSSIEKWALLLGVKYYWDAVARQG
jgi:hypothetical protein